MKSDVSALLLGILAGLAAVVVAAAATVEYRHEEIEQISGCDDDDFADCGAGDRIIAISPA